MTARNPLLISICIPLICLQGCGELSQRISWMVRRIFLTQPFALYPAMAEESGPFRLVAEANFPTGFSFNDTEVGGLSAIAYDADTNQFLILSDDRQNPRIYTATIALEADSLSLEGIVFQDGILLRSQLGDPFAAQSLDPEGIALSQINTVYLSSEGDVERGIDPWLGEFGLDGHLIEELPVPEKFLLTDGRQGVRNNLAFESLTLTPNDRFLLTATENALTQDGPMASGTQGSPVRIVKYDLATRLPVAEFLYETEPVPFPAQPSGQFSTNGLVELLALDEEATTLLALERSFSVGVGNTVRLYRVDLSDATNVSDLDSILVATQSIIYAQKDLLLNLADLDLSMGLDNLEGMTFGPLLPNGRQSLILVGDNNFNQVQFTQFIILSIDPGVL